MVAKRKAAAAPAATSEEVAEAANTGWGAPIGKLVSDKDAAANEAAEAADAAQVAEQQPDEPASGADDGPQDVAGTTPPDEPPKRGRGRPKNTIPDVDLDGDNARQMIIGYVERAERLAEEAAGVREDMKELMAEVKANGFNVKILREVIRRRKQDGDARQEHDALLELYENVVGFD